MTTPTGQISLDDVQTEFGGANPIGINEYYAGGSYVPSTVAGVPTSGQISLDNLRGKTKIIYAISASISPSSGDYPYTSTISWTSNLPVDGYVNISITYPNSTTSQLTNQVINGSATANWTSTTGSGSGSVILRGYSSTGTLLVTSSTLNYTVTTPPTYAFGTIPTSINEGSSGTFNVTTTNVANGTTLYWTIGSNAGDFSTTSGSFTITANTGSFSVTPTADITTEGAETFFVYVRTGSTSGSIVATSSNVTINDTSVATYSLTPSVSSVNEGGSFTITFATNQSGSFAYTISGTGITSADIGGASLTGTVTNGTVLTYNVTADSLTEGNETFTIALNNGLASTSVTIVDTSKTPPTYSFGVIPTSINEGSSGTFNVNTTNVDNGTTLYWTIATNAGDFGTTSGSFTITSNTGSFSVSPTADITTEGTETFTVAIRTGSTSGTVVATSSTVNIIDTSVATYSLTPSVSSVNEGGSFTITFATNQSGSFAYTISGTGITSADIGGALLTGTVTNGTVLTYNVTADSTTENTETFTIALNNGLASTSVTINDTSITPATYAFTTTPTSINEGSAGTFSVTGTNVPGGNATLYWTINNISTTNADFVATSGSFTMTSSVGSFSITPTADITTEGSETFSVSVRTGSTGGTIVATSSSVTVTDTSVATYSLTPSVSSVNEGSSFTITFATNQSGNFAYTITGVTSADINSAALTGTVANGTVLTYNVTADNLTEGNETFTIKLDAVPTITTSVTILDTSLTPPSYAFSTTPTSINEGSAGTFIVTGTNVPGGNATLYWTINNISTANADFSAVSGTFTMTSSSGSFTITPTADNSTEGAQTFTVSIRTGSTSGTVVATSATVTVNDTSVNIIPVINTFSVTPSTHYPADNTTITWTTTNANSVNLTIKNPSGSNIVNQTVGTSTSYVYTGNVANSLGQYTVVLTATSSTGDTAQQTQYFTVVAVPTYSVTPSVTSVNEGGSFTITFATNQSGSLSYSISGVTSADIGGASLTGTAANGTVITYNVTADSSTEGTEYFNIVYFSQASAQVTINDTSITPVIPSFTSSSASPTSTYNTNNVTISWTTSNASSVSMSIKNPSGSTILTQTVGTSSSYTYTGSSSASIGQWTVTLTATSTTGNTATATVNWTYTAPPSFSATYNSFTPVQPAGTTVSFSQANSNIVINGGDLDNINASGTATYTTTGTGYLYCFLYVGTEYGADFGYFQFDGVTQYSVSSPGTGYTKNGSGGYSGGPGYVLNNFKIGPISAGTHNIKIIYTKDYQSAANGDIVSGAWTWSAT